MLSKPVSAMFRAAVSVAESGAVRRASSAARVDRPIHQHLKSVPVSPTLAISEQSNGLLRQGKTVYRFGLGQSPFPVFAPMVDELVKYAPTKDYYATAGLASLREVVASHMSERTQRYHSADDVLIGPGSKELIFLLQMCLDADLILPSPSWVTYQPQAQMLGRRALWVETSLASDWKLSPQGLDKALDQHSQYSYSYPRLLVLNSPSNPTGVAYTDHELAALASVCRKHNVMVLSDEIYGRLTYRVSPEQARTDESRKGSDRPGHAHASIARHLPESTIVLDGISKWAGAGGWRLGAFCFPKEMHWLRQAMMAAASETFSSVSAPIQHAAIPAFAKEQEPAMAEYLSTANRILRLVSSFQTASLLQAGAEARMPHGGFYCFPDFSRTPTVSSGEPRTSVELAGDILQQTGVAMLPGTAFGRLPSEPTFRLAFVDFDGARAMEAIDGSDRFGAMLPDWTESGGEEQQLQREFLEEFCGPVFHGTKALCDYLCEPSE